MIHIIAEIKTQSRTVTALKREADGRPAVIRRKAETKGVGTGTKSILTDAAAERYANAVRPTE